MDYFVSVLKKKGFYLPKTNLRVDRCRLVRNIRLETRSLLNNMTQITVPKTGIMILLKIILETSIAAHSGPEL